VIDADDLGLLEHTQNGSEKKPLKTLTRKSIKPTRLFQTEEQKRMRELEKEEEALTDIEDTDDVDGGVDSDHLTTNHTDDNVAPAKSSRSLRSANKVSVLASEEADRNGTSRHSGKKASPFDSWPRVKTGARSDASTLKGKKRGAVEAVGDDTGTAGTELKRTRT
jgi:hypothetical protein